MNFNTQISTSVEQSRQLLSLGLKKETADMYLTRCFVGNNGTPMIFVGCTYNPSTVLYSKEDVPAWSLHRLIAMCPDFVIAEQKNHEKLYEQVISNIKFAIEEGTFDEKYLED